MHFWDRHKTITGYYESLTSSICNKMDEGIAAVPSILEKMLQK